ncbi:hypothetical protein OUZ56_017672 [Daphnia magna]|uniref:Uncharacterized protein n=1 Tax=Daphnia magna TaxID=35525 RepID=A0ABR0ATD9_9CRUS|nr:hypothetical protein OUZ56_017672 [Daphnia magna]
MGSRIDEEHATLMGGLRLKSDGLGNGLSSTQTICHALLTKQSWGSFLLKSNCFWRAWLLTGLKSRPQWSAEDRNLKTGIGASPEKRRIQAEEQACRRGWPAAELVILDCYDKGPENCVLEASVIRQERLRSGLQEQVSC